VHPCATLCLLTRPFGGAHTAKSLHGENRMAPPPGYNSRAHGALNSIYGNCSACASGALSWHAVKLAVLAARRRGGDIPCTVAVLHCSMRTGCSERMGWTAVSCAGMAARSATVTPSVDSAVQLQVYQSRLSVPIKKDQNKWVQVLESCLRNTGVTRNGPMHPCKIPLRARRAACVPP
jgi:hypothetical protein